MTMVPLDDLAFISRASFGTMPHDGWLYGAILPSTFKDDDELDKSKSLRMAFVYPDFSTAIVGRFSPTGKKRMPWALNGGSGVPARLITLSCLFQVQSRHSAMSFPLPPLCLFIPLSDQGFLHPLPRGNPGAPLQADVEQRGGILLLLPGGGDTAGGVPQNGEDQDGPIRQEVSKISVCLKKYF